MKKSADIIKKFIKKNDLKIKNLNQALLKLNKLNKKLGTKQDVIFDAKFGRETQYYTGLAFQFISKTKSLLEEESITI